MVVSSYIFFSAFSCRLRTRLFWPFVLVGWPLSEIVGRPFRRFLSVVCGPFGADWPWLWLIRCLWSWGLYNSLFQGGSLGWWRVVGFILLYNLRKNNFLDSVSILVVQFCLFLKKGEKTFLK